MFQWMAWMTQTAFKLLMEQFHVIMTTNEVIIYRIKYSYLSSQMSVHLRDDKLMRFFSQEALCKV